jgi:protein involved in polysaccharide export with SLBB domain
MRWLWAVFCLVLVSSGCQSDKSAKVLTPDNFMKVTGSSSSSETATNGASTNVTSRIIRPGMTISITVDEDRSLNRMYNVPVSGAIDYPPLNRVMVEGLTPEEVAQTIKQALEKDYFRTATVTCAIESVTGGGGAGIIYVLGNVGRPGPLLVGKDQGLTVMKAIIAAGGFGAFANAKKVELIRYDENGKKYKTIIDVKRIMDGEFEKDVPVKDGDWIIIREKLLNF